MSMPHEETYRRERLAVGAVAVDVVTEFVVQIGIVLFDFDSALAQFHLQLGEEHLPHVVAVVDSWIVIQRG